VVELGAWILCAWMVDAGHLAVSRARDTAVQHTG
jgi:hypothetical protein